MNAYGSKQYQQTQVTTVDKGRLIILLYEGAIKFLSQAKECQASGDIPGKTNCINRAMDIINELNQSLNLQEGGEISQNLKRLYEFWNDHLIRAKVRKEAQPIDDVIKMMASLTEAWRKVCQPAGEPASEGTPTSTNLSTSV